MNMLLNTYSKEIEELANAVAKLTALVATMEASWPRPTPKSSIVPAQDPGLIGCSTPNS
jgi:hypothetical protein